MNESSELDIKETQIDIQPFTLQVTKNGKENITHIIIPSVNSPLIISSGNSESSNDYEERRKNWNLHGDSLYKTAKISFSGMPDLKYPDNHLEFFFREEANKKNGLGELVFKKVGDTIVIDRIILTRKNHSETENERTSLETISNVLRGFLLEFSRKAQEDSRYLEQALASIKESYNLTVSQDEESKAKTKETEQKAALFYEKYREMLRENGRNINQSLDSTIFQAEIDWPTISRQNTLNILSKEGMLPVSDEDTQDFENYLKNFIQHAQLIHNHHSPQSSWSNVNQLKEYRLPEGHPYTRLFQIPVGSMSLSCTITNPEDESTKIAGSGSHGEFYMVLPLEKFSSKTLCFMWDIDHPDSIYKGLPSEDWIKTIKTVSDEVLLSAIMHWHKSKIVKPTYQTYFECYNECLIFSPQPLDLSKETIEIGFTKYGRSIYDENPKEYQKRIDSDPTLRNKKLTNKPA